MRRGECPACGTTVCGKIFQSGHVSACANSASWNSGYVAASYESCQMTVSLTSDALQATPVPANDEPVVVRPNTSVLGCLTIDGDAIIHGQVDGELRADNVFIAKGGMVLGTIVASEVVVEGSALDALVFADRIVLRQGSQTTGEIWHKELVLEAGHLFEGKSRRHSEPRSLAPNDADDREE